MPAFTPGPWNIHHAYPLERPVRTTGGDATFDFWDGVVAKGEVIIGAATMQSTSSRGWPHIASVEEARANTWLMCSAPELHAAVMEAISLLGSYDFLDDKAAQVLAQLRDALAKSEGRVIA